MTVARNLRRSALLALPLGLALLLLALLARSLHAAGPSDRAKPAASALLQQAAPPLRAARLDDPTQAFDAKDLRGQVWVLNVWASWCAPCRTELPALQQLARSSGVAVLGLNYKDSPQLGQRFLDQHGNPYRLSVLDPQGQAAIDWGVVAVPETFVVDGRGRIRWQHSGPLSAEQVQRELLPLIRKLQGA